MLDQNTIFAILREQNYWHKEIKLDYVPRRQYLDSKLIRSKSILVIKGPRRAGKTVLLKQIIGLLGEHNIPKEQILYVNLEYYKFFDHYSLDLLEEILEVYRENINPDKQVYFFLDEIQNINGFERFLRTKYDSEENIKLIITGSNAKLLSKELGTLLTGRISTIEVLPFSFDEYLIYHKIDIAGKKYYEIEHVMPKVKKLFNQYLKLGAIPEFLDEPNPSERIYEYFDNVLFRDIVQRFNIRNSKLIKELALFLLTNSAKLFSINKISKAFGVSINTIQSYLSDLELSYLFFYLDMFSYSLKEQITTQSKVYSMDTGLINTLGFRFSEDLGRILENLVFIELKRVESEIYYHKDIEAKSECDFIIKKGTKITQVIQVTKTLKDEKTKEREIKGLKDALEKYDLRQGLLLTKDDFDNLKSQGYDIKVRPIWFWLLNKEE